MAARRKEPGDEVAIDIPRDPGADSRGERQIKRAKSVRATVYKTGGNSPWEDTFNGLVQEPICVLASD